MGRVPCLYNGEPANLLLVFDSEHEKGYVAGVMSDYRKDDEVDVVAKAAAELQEGDVIQPICDVYLYDGTYKDSYLLGKPYEIVNSAADLVISDTLLGEGKALITYRFTDIYGADHWTETLTR